MATDERGEATTDLTAAEREALHELELGLEWLHRAHGALMEFHHNTGHAMEHVAAAEAAFRESGHDEVADAIRDEYLPRGVIDEERWSYDVVESFQRQFLSDMRTFERRTREALADGRRHVTEREQEREWKRRSDRQQ